MLPTSQKSLEFLKVQFDTSTEVGLWGVGQGEGLGVQEAIADDPKGDSVQVEVEGGRDLENAIGFSSVCWNQNIGAKVNPKKRVQNTREVKRFWF